MKRELVIATYNLDKKKEIEKILSGLNLKILTLLDFPDLPQIEEDGYTFEDNAIKKAVFYARKTKHLSLADDSGLVVKYLNGKPGVYSARFAGEDATAEENNKKLLRLLKGVPLSKRRAEFVCCIALADVKGLIKLVKGTCVGRIAKEMKGNYGFGYDPVFIPSGYNKTFAELGEKIKNKISHRSWALRKIKKFMEEYWGKYAQEKG
ncbi:MAG: XTP/dITP diphosphatase [Candidatus Omnitrophica bacterium]|nr:XTP/dITP diphosphatase [Candidatus Omnitrophota bacterium]MCM8792976.1 XTP/dITP diphosphatase [Candidatus Omnitrophota bacterium]